MTTLSEGQRSLIAFDVYGTLIDTRGIEETLVTFIGDRAGSFSSLWRAKQLEYSFRRGLMRVYEPFDVCTAQALDYTCNELGMDLSAGQRAALLSRYRELPAFPDVEPALESLEALGHAVVAFSNGREASIEELLRTAGIRDRFDKVVSVESLQTFKPDPDVYAHVAAVMGVAPYEALLVSGNSFDVLGAMAAGLRAAWIRRSSQGTLDPWGMEPTITIESLEELASAIERL